MSIAHFARRRSVFAAATQRLPGPHDLVDARNRRRCRMRARQSPARRRAGTAVSRRASRAQPGRPARDADRRPRSRARPPRARAPPSSGATRAGDGVHRARSSRHGRAGARAAPTETPGATMTRVDRGSCDLRHSRDVPGRGAKRTATSRGARRASARHTRLAGPRTRRSVRRTAPRSGGPPRRLPCARFARCVPRAGGSRGRRVSPIGDSGARPRRVSARVDDADRAMSSQPGPANARPTSTLACSPRPPAALRQRSC